MEYTSDQLNAMGMGWANDTPSGEIRNGYRVIDTGRGTRMLEPASQSAYGGQTSSSPDDFLAQLKAELTAQMDEMAKRTKEFDEKNPFMFDEILAQRSAEERYNPYYEAELKDFTSGIQRQRESKEGEMKLLSELNRVKAGQEARDLEDAISASEEGYAGQGLFFSGARERATGKQVIGAQDTANVREKQFGFSQQEGRRSLDNLAQEDSTYKRRLQADKTTNIQTEIEKQKAEEQARWNTERAQYIGYPYTSSITGGLNQFITNAFS